MAGKLARVRAWLLLIAGMGCGFDLRAPAASDALDVDAPGAAPDAPLTPPACLTSAAYTAGGPQAEHRYRVVAATSVYDAAVATCAEDGAHLVAIESMAENMFIDTLLANTEAWLGYDDLAGEGTFRWVNGAPEGFRNFSGGEPNDNGVEDCTMFRTDGSWNDEGCGEVYRAVCECDPSYVAPPVAACRAVAGGQVFNGRDYHVRTAYKSWPDAVADCAAIGAYLAVPGDADENSFIDTRFGADSWIGGSDRTVEGTFVWVNDAPVGFTRWGTAQPSGLLDEDCVAIALVMPSAACWDDTNCGILRQFACECAPLAR